MGEFVQTTMLRPFVERPEEAAIIARLLAGYGELEFFLHLNVSEVLGSQDMSARVLFRLRSEQQRIDVADSILRAPFEQQGLLGPYKDAHDAMQSCRKIRNQYAHCHWDLDDDGNLRFTSLDEAAKTKTGSVVLKFALIEKDLLVKQEEYFAYCQGMLAYCLQEWSRKLGRVPNPTFAKPKGRPAPPLHNSQ